MVGSKALSCSCPPSEASVTVRSLPMTRNATWLTTSGITGLTLPGMIDEPACTAGRRISPKPGPRPARQQSQVVADLRELDGDALEQAGEQHERAHVGGRLDQVAGEHHLLPGHVRQLLDGERGIARVGVDAGADRGRAEIDLTEEARELVQPGDVLLHGGVEGVELLAERHRHRVLQLRAPHLEDVAELDRLLLQRVGQVRRAPLPARGLASRIARRTAVG